MYRGWWQGHGTPSLPFKIIRPEEEPGHVYLIAFVYASKGRVAKSHCHVNRNNTGNEATQNQRVSICNDGRVLSGPQTKVVCHLPKKYKRADLAGGGGRWAEANSVLRYQIMGQSQYHDLLEWGCPDAQGVHPSPWQCTLSHTCHAKEAEPRDARAYIRALGSAHCATPATPKRWRPKGRQGVHPSPWQCTLCHACHAKEAETQGTPGRTSEPLAVHIVPRLPRQRGGDPRDARAYIRALDSAHSPTPATTPERTSEPLTVHIVPRLPRKSGGDPRDARAYIQPLGSAHCPTPATQKRRRPKGRQGVHPSPWQCTLSHACHAKEAETQGTPGRTSEPWQHCLTPATQKTRRPKGRQGVHPSPWQCTLCYACHAKEAETQGTPGRTSEPLTVHIVPRLPRKSGGDPRDARAYIRALDSAHCPTPATQKRRRPKGRQGVHPTPWQCTLPRACHAKAAETQGTPGRTSEPLTVHIVPRLPRKRGGDPRDARAYIRALGSAHCPTPATQKRRRPKGRQGVHPSPWQRTLSHACHAKEAETQGTPGRTSEPWQHCPTPATQKTQRPKGRQGVHPSPWQCTLCYACHAKEAETQGTPGRTSEPLTVHIVPRLPRKSGGDPRDARAYIRALDSAHCPTPATQKRRRPKGRQGVHPTPWQCTLPRACHAKEAETQGTPGRTSEPLAVHIVPRLPRQRGGDPRDARAYIRALDSAHCPTPATQKRRRPKGRQGVHPTPWQCTLSHACHAKCTLSEWVWVWVWVWVRECVRACVSEWVSVCEMGGGRREAAEEEGGGGRRIQN